MTSPNNKQTAAQDASTQQAHKASPNARLNALPHKRFNKDALLATNTGIVAQLIKFGIVGVIAFAVDFGLLVILREVFKIHPVIGSVFSFIASVLVNYALSMRYVFARREDIARHRELIVFILLSVIGLGINTVIMWLGNDILQINYIIDKVVATVVVLVWNFLSRKRWLEA